MCLSTTIVGPFELQLSGLGWGEAQDSFLPPPAVAGIGRVGLTLPQGVAGFQVKGGGGGSIEPPKSGWGGLGKGLN